MSLYIRLSTNFFSHVKTLRLKAAIGNDAFWLPPRLWVYAAEHQPDGNLSRYSAEEIAMLVGYQGDAQAMLQAMLKVGFLDANPLRVHGWEEHNGYHQSFADRASKAANARWKRKEMTGNDRKGHEKREAMLDSLPSNAQASGSALEPVEKLKAAISELYQRPNPMSWANDEERELVDIVRRADWESELSQIQEWFAGTRADDKRFLPGSVRKMLQDWTGCLDKARMAPRRNGVEKPSSRDEFTFANYRWTREIGPRREEFGKGDEGDSDFRSYKTSWESWLERTK